MSENEPNILYRNPRREPEPATLKEWSGEAPDMPIFRKPASSISGFHAFLSTQIFLTRFQVQPLKEELQPFPLVLKSVITQDLQPVRDATDT